jgi:plastocyanin
MFRTISVLMLILGGCAAETTASVSTLPDDQLAIPQTFALRVDGTQGGEPISFIVSGATPNSNVKLVRAVNGASQPGPCPPPLGGQCLDIDGPNGVAVFGFTMTTDSRGLASRTLTLPSTVADGTEVSFQAVVPGANVGSNTVDFVVGPADPLANAQCAPDFAGCSPRDFASNDFTTAFGTIDIDMVGMRPYSPTCLMVRVGQTVTIEATSSHPFRKECAEDDIMDSQDGDRSTVEFTFETAGYYNYRCAINSHVNMLGNIMVVP